MSSLYFLSVTIFLTQSCPSCSPSLAPSTAVTACLTPAAMPRPFPHTYSAAPSSSQKVTASPGASWAVERFGALVLPRAATGQARQVRQPESVSNVAREVGSVGLQTCITVSQIIFN